MALGLMLCPWTEGIDSWSRALGKGNPEASVLNDVLSDSCVVALLISWGLEGDFRIECDVDGREVRIRGRGGNGGGVPSRDGDEIPLVEALRVTLLMIFSVGFAKSCCSISSLFVDAPWLLCLSVEGALLEDESPSFSARPVSGMCAAIIRPHQDCQQRGSVCRTVGTRSGATCEVRLAM